jgi:signal peptidase I
MRRRWAAGALVGIALGCAAVLLLRRFDVVVVRGRSMAPALRPGDRLVVARARPRPGDVVLAADPRRPRRELIKRVRSISHGRVDLRGDNPAASTDARAFGTVPLRAVRWRVLARTWPPGRIGPVPRSVVGDELDRE